MENRGSTYLYHCKVETKQNTVKRKTQTTVGGSSKRNFKKTRSTERRRDTWRDIKATIGLNGLE